MHLHIKTMRWQWDDDQSRWINDLTLQCNIFEHYELHYKLQEKGFIKQYQSLFISTITYFKFSIKTTKEKRLTIILKPAKKHKTTLRYQYLTLFKTHYQK